MKVKEKTPSQILFLFNAVKHTALLRNKALPNNYKEKTLFEL